MQEKLRDVIDQQVIPVDEDTDGDVRAMMAKEEKSMFDNYPEGSFQRLFWEEQKKTAARKDLRGIRWHPLMIRFCLYLKHHLVKHMKPSETQVVSGFLLSEPLDITVMLLKQSQVSPRRLTFS